ncbi:outer membrane protein assembly factor BamB family protein [Halosimplex salinum]|uniref:outer membrane protein assembly factor BamB family protein n=1 Tax=Halosimplex salinum TaxID=1710538 RepID=UPI0013DD87A7|nr:PQQ-binding-like beta-propeller repeat protein [Halosimplex salinum]
MRIGGIGCAIGAAGCLGGLTSSDGDGGDDADDGDGGGNGDGDGGNSDGGDGSGGLSGPLATGGPDGWPRVHRDSATTGLAGAPGPKSSVEEVWTASTAERSEVTPVVADGTVYVESPGGVAALDAETGTEAWTKELEDSPAYLTVLDGTLYLEAGGMRALDASDGSEQWTYDEVPVHGSPTVVDGTVYVGKSAGELVALDASNGEESWSFTTDHGIGVAPAVANGTVYLTTLPDDGSKGDLLAVDAESGDEVWRVDGVVLRHQTPTVADGSVFLQEQYVTARSADDGEMEWEYDESELVVVPRTVAYADGTVYVGSKRPASSTTAALALDAASGDLHWERSLEGNAVDGPILSAGVLYVGTTTGMVYALDASSGETAWDHSIDGRVVSSPALADGRLYVPSEEETLHALAEA